MHIRRSVAALSLVTLPLINSACGLVKVQSSSPSSPSSNGTSSNAGAPAEAPAGGDRDLAARFAEAYRAFDYTTCPDRMCGGRMPATAGLGMTDHVNPRMHMANPDPDWLPGWDQLPAGVDDPADDIKVWNAMTLAATGKRWQANCHAAYDRLDGELRAFDDAWRTRIAQARAGSNRYHRLAGLLALVAQLDAETEDTDHATRLRSTTGARFELEVAIREEAAHELPAYAYHYLRLDPEIDFRYVRPRGDAAEERALFCAAAAAGQVADISPMPRGGPFDGEVQAQVRSPVAPDVAARFEGSGAANAAANVARFGGPKDSKVFRAAALPSGAEEISGTVRATRPTPAGLAVELSDTRSTVVSYNCKSTGRIGRISADGRVERDQKCQLRTELDETVHHVVLAGLEGDLVPSAGDRISVVGRVTGERKSERKKFHRVLDRTVDAELLVSVTSKGQTHVVASRSHGTLDR